MGACYSGGSEQYVELKIKYISCAADNKDKKPPRSMENSRRILSRDPLCWRRDDVK